MNKTSRGASMPVLRRVVGYMLRSYAPAFALVILCILVSAVDTATDAKIRAALAQYLPGTTKLIIAQRISSVESADRILVLDNGRVDGFDTHENLLKTNAIYREIYDSQVKGGGDFDQSA